MISGLHFEIEIKGDSPIGVQLIKTFIFLQFKFNSRASSKLLFTCGRAKHLCEEDSPIELTQLEEGQLEANYVVRK